jgi:hypothetical protein
MPYKFYFLISAHQLLLCILLKGDILAQFCAYVIQPNFHGAFIKRIRLKCPSLPYQLDYNFLVSASYYLESSEAENLCCKATDSILAKASAFRVFAANPVSASVSLPA